MSQIEARLILPSSTQEGEAVLLNTSASSMKEKGHTLVRMQTLAPQDKLYPNSPPDKLYKVKMNSCPNAVAVSLDYNTFRLSLYACL